MKGDEEMHTYAEGLFALLLQLEKHTPVQLGNLLYGGYRKSNIIHQTITNRPVIDMKKITKM